MWALAVALLAPTWAQESCPAPIDSDKRGAATHFCGWPFAQGVADLDAMDPGLAWFYNWSSKPMDCPDGKGVGETVARGSVEFVPMAWGLIDNGEACGTGGPCFRVDERAGGAPCAAVCEASGWSFAPEGDCYACYHEGISRAQFLADVPAGSEFLLGFNEPNFKEQANLGPEAAALAWEHLEWVADQRDLKLVGPATNYCDPTPGVVHAGSCIDAVDGRRMYGLAWLETFYDACSEDGAVGRNCRIDHQAVHAYSCDDVTGMIDLMKRKAGLLPPEAEHCSNGEQDEDEFGVDCGGNFCAACSEHARDQFAKPVWLTEFAPTSGECGDEDADALMERAQRFMAREVGELEADPYVHRYAWFMPKTDIASLDHADLLVEDRAGVRTSLGELYFGEACASGAVPVGVERGDSGYRLIRGGRPYELRGVGGSQDLELLAQIGGNSFRTWGVGEETAGLLDRAEDLGLTVSLGVWLGHERHGFDYDDPEQVAEQLEAAREAVLAYRDHPALLMWGVGNEMEGFESGDDPAIWEAVCDVAEMVQALDPHHPVMTTTADIGGGRVASVARCEAIDIHGINSYGGAPSLARRFGEAGGDKPIVLTEYGPPGTWEIPMTDYGSPPELTSTAKAEIYGDLAVSLGPEPRILGGYAFLWAFKTEATATWYGLFLPDGTRLGGVDALAAAWSGSREEVAPLVTPLSMERGDKPMPGERVEVRWTVEDNGPIETHWEVRREILEKSTGGDPQGLPPALREAVIASDAESAVLQIPEANGIYRVYAVARDEQGNGATASLPFLVGEPRGLDDPLPMPWFVYQDEGVGGPWVPSGAMGSDSVEVDRGWTEGCASPPSCIRVKSAEIAWSGMAWQFPANNWGSEDGGLDLSEARVLKFRVRGDFDFGSATFGVGIAGEDQPFPDSLKVEKTVKLKSEWREVTLRLRGDRGSVLTGFWWVLPEQRPVTVYLDDIRFE